MGLTGRVSDPPLHQILSAPPGSMKGGFPLPAFAGTGSAGMTKGYAKVSRCGNDGGITQPSSSWGRGRN